MVAYRNAAKAIRESAASVEELARAGPRRRELPGVGKTIAEKIDALLETGSIPAAEKLKAKFPPGLVEVTRIPGLGPEARAQALRRAGHRVARRPAQRPPSRSGCATSPGFGAKAEENVLAALAAGARRAAARRALLLSQALAIAEELVAALREHPASDRVELAGQRAALAETCKDLDIVATASDPDGAGEGVQPSCR